MTIIVSTPEQAEAKVLQLLSGATESDCFLTRVYNEAGCAIVDVTDADLDDMVIFRVVVNPNHRAGGRAGV